MKAIVVDNQEKRVPHLLCDYCHFPIWEGMFHAAVVEFDYDDPEHELLVLHKACAMKTGRLGVHGWIELTSFIGDLEERAAKVKEY